MSRSLRIRLSLMMFLQYFVMGATFPIMSLYLRQSLGFTGTQTGAVLAMSAVAASVAPVIGALLADSVVSAEHLLVLCHLAAGLLMAMLAIQTAFVPVLLLFLCYMIALRPTIGLTNAVGFHHLPGERSGFANVRVWGTVGWIVVGWLFSLLWLRGAGAESRLPDALKLGAALSVGMALYSLTLPRGNAEERTRQSIIPREAFAVFARRPVLVLAFVSFAMFVVYQYYYVGAAPYLKHIGLSEARIMPVMSLGQISEVIMMTLVAATLRRVDIKWVLCLGVLSEVIRFSAFAAGGSLWIILAGISCHGVSIAFFMTASVIYLDTHCSPAARSGAQQILSIICFGLAGLLGSLVAGWTTDVFTVGETVHYRMFWSVPAASAACALLALLVFFPRNSDAPPAQGR